MAVLSYGVWQREFGGRREVVGSLARLNGEAYTVIGVMPKTFRFPMTEISTIYTPLHPDQRELTSRGFHEFSLIAALKPGLDVAHGQADAARVMADLARAYTDADGGRTVKVEPVNKVINGDVAQPLMLMSGAVGTLLLIACVNVAGLLFARGVRREHEMALRAAVGASRNRLTRQTLTETMSIALLGAALGAVVATLLLAAMRSFLLKSLARGLDVHVNGMALLAALTLAVLTTLLAGLLPALRLSRISPNAALRGGASAAGTTRAQQRLRSGFLVTQVALSLVLLSVSVLLVQQLQSLMSMDLGYPPDRLMAVRISLGAGDYKSRDPLGDFYAPLLERMQHLPGLANAGLVNLLPIEMYGSNAEVQIVGQPHAAANEGRLAEYRLVSSGYFATMGSQLMAGRALTPSLDRPETNTFAVNRAFTREFVPGAKTAVGAQMDDGTPTHALVVGEYADMRQAIDRPQMAEMDFLMNSEPVEDRRRDLLHLFLVVRAAEGVDPMSFVTPLRGIVHGIDAGAALSEAMTMRDELNEALVFQRMQGALFGTFAACALLLTLVGIYGTVRHETELRTRDIGVRMALGASRGRVLATVLGRAAVLAGAGLVLGLVLTEAARRSLASLVELKPGHELELLLLVACGLLAMCVLAAFGPARRAASIEPTQALRSE